MREKKYLKPVAKSIIRISEPNLEMLDKILARIGLGTRPALANSILSDSLAACDRCGNLEAFRKALQGICQGARAAEPRAGDMPRVQGPPARERKTTYLSHSREGDR